MSRHLLSILSTMALTMGIPAAGADEPLITASAAMGPWNGELEQTTENRRPLHFAEVPVELSLSCPSGAVASLLEYDFDPAEGVIDPHPASGIHLDANAALQQTGSQSRHLTVALRPGALYRVRITGSCCTALDSSGACLGEGERIEVISEPIEIPPIIEAARVIDEGFHYGGLLVGQSLDLTVYDSAPMPGWSIEADNVRKFLKFKGAGIDFKTGDYRGTNSKSVTTLLPKQAGEVEVTVTLKGKLYTPAGQYLRDYTLVSEPFSIPVTQEPCVLDANVGTFIVEGQPPECLDESILKPQGEEDVSVVGCASAGSMGLMMGWLALALLPALRRRR